MSFSVLLVLLNHSHVFAHSEDKCAQVSQRDVCVTGLSMRHILVGARQMKEEIPLMNRQKSWWAYMGK